MSAVWVEPIVLSKRRISRWWQKMILSVTKSSARQCFITFQRKLSVKPDSESNHVQVESVDLAGVITINRPQAMNSITERMIQKIYRAITDIEREKKLLIIKGLPNCFSSGGDLKAVLRNTRIDELITMPLAAVTAYNSPSYHVAHILNSYKIPYISLMDGIAMGSALGLGMAARYRVATERTLMAMPENKIGHFPDTGSSYFLTRLPRNFGIYLGVTGDTLKGNTTLKAGMATQCVNSQKLPELEASLVKCTNYTEIEAALNRHTERVDPGTPDIDNIDHIEKCFVPDTVEKIIERLETVQNDWSRKVLKTMRTQSPASMKITLRMLRCSRTAELSYAECLQMEYSAIVNGCGLNYDMVPGIREFMSKRRKVSGWNPPTLEQVDDAFVESNFKPLPPQKALHLRS